MNSDITSVVGRLCARELGRAVPIRSMYSISPDPSDVFGVAFIRVAAEERVQAIAYGLMNTQPNIITIYNPLARSAQELEPFARAFHDYLTEYNARGELPRVWLGHTAALTVLDLLGHRYQSNSHVTDILRKMGRQCRALCEEATFPGQQVTAVASTLLMEHLVTGQSAVEDQHLGAMLAWIDPLPEINPVDLSQRRSLVPAASLLTKKADDEVERLRRLARQYSSSNELIAIRRRICALLEDGVKHEWSLLEEAHTAFWKLGLHAAPPQHMMQLISDSHERLRYFLNYGAYIPSRPHSLSLRLDTYEYAAALVGELDACCDKRVRERLRATGRVLSIRVEAVEQPNKGRHPCTLTLATDQPVRRIRSGTRLKSINGQILGRVIRQIEGDDKQHRIVFRLLKGVRKGRPQVGQEFELVDTIPFDSRQVKRLIYKLMHQSDSALVYHHNLPPNVHRRLPLGSILESAERSRRR